ncbi:MAG: metallophosphoesterase [Oscillospiraceae bacterium]|nr:metallophosphoesterase [Oscillospiraceae bacterium]
MSLYCIGDLHLSLGSNKPMDIFPGWENYINKIEKNFLEIIKPEDTVVIPGDISWAINFKELYEDFKFLESMPGKKILLKGNHDYWFNTKKKMDNFILENSFSSISILHNDSKDYGDYFIAGTRGWVNENKENVDKKVLLREAGRLEISITHGMKKGKKPIVFLHYPPLYKNSYNKEMLSVLNKYKIDKVYYGHIHGEFIKYAKTGIHDGIEYNLVSSDFLNFKPHKIM